MTIIDAYGTGSGAAATATVTGGVITGFTVTNAGAGYSAPIVEITDANGTGATAAAVKRAPDSAGASGSSSTKCPCLDLAEQTISYRFTVTASTFRLVLRIRRLIRQLWVLLQNLPQTTTK